MMPPKKKRKGGFQNAKPGIGRSHLEENFAELPASLGDLQKGHILRLYMSLDKSKVAVVKQLFDQYPNSVGDQGGNTDAICSRINVAVNQAMKYKKLSNPTELEKYAGICKEPFKFLHSTTVSRRSRKQNLTPRKHELKIRLDFVSTSRASAMAKHRTRIDELRKKLKTPTRVTNQALKKKDMKIDSLKRDIQELKAKIKKLSKVPENQELMETRSELLRLKKSHKQLLQYRKSLDSKQISLEDKMTGQKEKKSGSSLPCEVFFACTRCGARSRTVPQLHTHYRTVHKDEIANGTLTPKDSSESKSDTSPVEPKRTRSRAKLNSPAKSASSTASPSQRGRSSGPPMTDDPSSDVVYVEGSKTDPKPGPVIKHPEKDCTITRKRNVPLGMLEGKKNSLMVIFQHSDQNKPLPEGSSFKLRNAGGEQTYMVVANVDVDIIEQGKPPKKAKTGT